MPKLILENKYIQDFMKYRNCIRLTICLIRCSLSISRCSTFYVVKNSLNMTQLHLIHVLFTNTREARDGDGGARRCEPKFAELRRN